MAHDAANRPAHPRTSVATLTLGALGVVRRRERVEDLGIASAYGIAVTGTMALTSIVYFVVMRRTWKWPAAACFAVLALFLAFDLPFFVANTVKILDGGWVPVLIGIAFVGAMLVWSKGRNLLVEEYARRSPSIEEAKAKLLPTVVARVPGAAVFMCSSLSHVSPVLGHLVEREHILHEKVILLTVVIDRTPRVDGDGRLQARALGDGFYRVVANFGFMETPDVPSVIADVVDRLDLDVDPSTITYYLGRERFLATDQGSMGSFAESIFSYLQRNATSADRHFRIPGRQVIEVGIQMDL